MAFLDLGQSGIYYEEYGNGPPLVLAHGVGGNHASWHHQVPFFAKDYRVIVFDHRAFGNSPDGDGIGQSGYVGDMLSLLDSLEIEKAFLVGQSMGGGTCANFTCRHPSRVRALVIADSLVGFDAPEPLASQMRETAERNRNLSQVERVLGPVMQMDNPAQTLLYLQIASFNSVTVRTVKGTMPLWNADELAATGIPTLFVVGEHDVLFPPDAIHAVHQLLPGSCFELIEGAGHSAYFERPRAFNQHVGRFLAAQGDVG